MKYDITGRHLDVTPAIRAHVETQLDRVEGAFDGKPATAHVVIEVERGRNRAEVLVNWHNEVLKAETIDGDMYNSISMTIDKIEKQARKLKSRIVDKSHKAVKVTTLETDEEAA
jgi:putative sigma-54 modulation protein